MSDLKNQVVRLIEAGVPEQEIAGFIQKWDKGGAPEAPRSSFGRTLGLGARGVVEGIGDTINMLSAPNPTFTLARSLRNLKPELSEKMLGTTQIGEKSADALSLPTPKDSAGDILSRGFSFGTRNLLEGVGELPMLLNAPINAFFGTNLPNPGKVIADALGLQEAKTGGDEVLGAGIRGVAATLPTLGAGMASSMAKAAPKVASFLKASPVEQLAGSVAGNVAAEKARQSGAGPAAQFAAGMAGGMAPSAATLAGIGTGRTVRLTANMIDMLSDKGHKRAAGRQLRRVVGPDNVDDVLAQIKTREMPVEGVEPTLAQITLNPRVAVMEKGLESAGVEGADLIAHQLAQREAREAIAGELLESMETRQAARMADDQRRVDDAYSGVTERADALLQDRDARGLPERVGPQVKDVFGELYGAQKKATKEAYDAVRGDGSATFSVAPLFNSFIEALPQSRYAPKLPASIRDFLGVMQNDLQNGKLATFDDLQVMRTTLSAIADEAGHNGDRNLARIANDLKRRLDAYIDEAAEYADQPVTPQPGSAAYRDARKEALALSRAKVAADNPLWDSVWGHLDVESLYRDFPDARKELADLHGRGLFARRGEGLPIDELADSLKRQGYLTPDADSSTLVEILKSKVRGKGNSAAALDEVLENATQYPTGFTGEQKEAFRRAKAVRREQGERFEQGYNEDMSLGKVRDAEVMSNYFRTGAAGASAAQDFLRAFGNDARAMAAMKDYVLARFLRDSTDSSGKLSAAKMETFLKNYDAALRQFPEIVQNLDNLVAQQMGADAMQEAVSTAGKQSSAFGKTFLKRDAKNNPKLVGRAVDDRSAKELVERGLLSAGEVERLKGLTRSAERAKRAIDLAKVHGSPTSQNFATQDFLSNILGDNIDKQGGFLNKALSVPLNLALNPIVKNFYGDAAPGIHRHLARAASDPKYAAELLRAGNRRNLKSVGEVLTDRFNVQSNVTARSILDLLAEEDEKKKK